MIRHISFLLTVIGFMAGCHTAKKIPPVIPSQPEIVQAPVKADTLQPIPKMKRTDAFLEDLLKRAPGLERILANRDTLRVQVIYTQINRRAGNIPTFKNFYFNVDSGSYFYPASTVKMPAAVLALQRLNELKVYGLNSSSTMITEKAFSSQTAVYNDPTTTDGRPSLANYIKKIFLVSDNDAFNRLYEFLGQSYINERLHGMGFLHTDILHRLSISLTEEENRHTNPVSFYDSKGGMLYSQPMQVNARAYPIRKETVGTGYYRGEQLVSEPMDFSAKNRVSLEDLQGMLRSILFPASVPERQRFNLTDADYRFLWKHMSQYPSESKNPAYDTTNYWDAYGKFLLYGSEKGVLPGNVRIFNKIGDAYGFLTDVAYIVDFEKNIEFMLSATIYCNSDGILNDDRYDYDAVGFPFMKQLGRLVYDYEAGRPRPVQPDLSAFRMNYEY